MKWLARKILEVRKKLFYLCNQIVIHNVDVIGLKKKITRFFKKKSVGTAVLETAMTLPIILYIIFFSIELVRIELAQNAVDAIAKECTLSLMADRNYNKFDEIFKKYKPLGIPIGCFRYYCRLYPYMTSPDEGKTKGVMNVDPYGGETICWNGSDYKDKIVNTDQAPVNRNPNGGMSSDVPFYKYSTKFADGNDYGEVGNTERESLLKGNKSSSGYVFVLTVAVKFPFSSSFIAKLFNGGSNTNKSGVYILWARGSGVIN